MSRYQHRFMIAFVLAATFRQRDSECFGESVQTIAFGSCNQPERVSLWPQVSSFDPQVVVLLGDNMYADKKGGMFPGAAFVEASPEDIKREYALLERDEGFVKMVERAGGWSNIAATFDDHDYGINNGNKSYQYRKESQQLFWDFARVPQDSPLRGQSGVYSSKEHIVDLGSEGTQRGFRYKVIMLDTRSNSGPIEGTERGREGDFLGEEQWQWLEKELRSDVDLVLLGSSIQLLPTDKLTEERWGAYPSARMRLLSLVMGARCPNVLILSGDVHYAEISKARCSWRGREDSVENSRGEGTLIYELTSSGLTHTFSKKAPVKGRYGELQRDRMMETRERHSLRCFMYNLYQATFPSYYREQRYADHYQGLNFGLLDVHADPIEGGEGEGTKGTQGGRKVSRVTYRVMNHLGQAVITKSIPLKPRTPLSEVPPHRAPSDLHCEPFWGPLPPWRERLTVAIVLATIGIILTPFLFFVYCALRFLFKKLFPHRGVKYAP